MSGDDPEPSSSTCRGASATAAARCSWSSRRPASATSRSSSGSRGTSCASGTRTASSTRCWRLTRSPTRTSLARVRLGFCRAAVVSESIFHERVRESDEELLAAWLVSDSRDADIVAKEATRELTKLVQSRLGLELPRTRRSAKLRAVTLRYVLAGEFRSDLSCAAADLPRRRTEPRRRRTRRRRCESWPSPPHGFAEAIRRIADRVEDGARLAGTRSVPADASAPSTRSVSRRRALLSTAATLIAHASSTRRLRSWTEREHSFWLDRDVGRKAQWEACPPHGGAGKRGECDSAAVKQGRSGDAERLGRRVHVKGRLVPPRPGTAPPRGMGGEPRRGAGGARRSASFAAPTKTRARRWPTASPRRS